MLQPYLQRAISPIVKLVFILLLISLVFALLTGCGKISKDPTCVSLSHKQLQHWVDKGYIRSDRIATTVIRFRTAFAFPGEGFQVFAGVQDSSGKLITASIIELKPIDSCSKTHISLSDYIFTGTVPATISDWKIWDHKGNVNENFDHIYLEPFQYTYKDFQYLAFHDYVVLKDGHSTNVPRTNQAILGLLPCPPCENCKLPCPTFCSTCGPQIDSLPN